MDPESLYERHVVPLLVVGGLNLAGGVILQVLVASTFGTSGTLDAYYLADSFPGFLNGWILYGAVNVVLVPVLSARRREADPAGAWRVATTFATVLMVLAVAFAISCALGAGWIVEVAAPGFDPARRALAARLLRWLAGTTVLITAAAWMRGVLHAHGVFVVPQLGGVAAFLVTAAAVLIGSRAFGVAALVAGSLLGAGTLCAFQVVPLRSLSIPFRWGIDRAALRGPLVLFFTFMILSVAAQVSHLVDRAFASQLEEGSIVVLSLAQKLELPIVFVVSAAVSLPALTVFSSHAGDPARFRESMRASLRAMAVLALPAAGMLVVARTPLTRLLFSHGALSIADADRIALVTAALAGAFVIHAFGALLVNGFFSLGVVRLCVAVTVAGVGLNAALNRLLVGPYGVVGIALATTIAAAVANAVLWVHLRARLGGLGFEGRAAELGRVLATSALTVAAAAAAGAALEHATGRPLGSRPLGELALMVGAGAVAFVGSGRALAIPEIEALAPAARRMLGRRRPAPAGEEGPRP